MSEIPVYTDPFSPRHGGKGFLMSGTFGTLADIALWLLFILGVVSIVGPVIIGIVTRNLVGTINSVDDGKVWFYRHGLGFLIGAAALVAFFYGASLR